jgi:AcrR family transcriptional regulator
MVGAQAGDRKHAATLTETEPGSDSVTVAPVTSPTGMQRRRRDAQQNHQRLLIAARELFAERGVEVPIDDISSRAGVGTGTFYRHFPTREALVEALFEERVGEVVALCEGALAEADAWAGLVRFLEATLELQTSDRLLKEIFRRYAPNIGHLDETRKQLWDLFDRIVARAHAHAVLRTDFTVQDLMLVLWSFGPVIDATAAIAPETWRRHLHWILDGLRPTAATPQTEPPIERARLREAMQCLREQHTKRAPSSSHGETTTPRASRSG